MGFLTSRVLMPLVARLGSRTIIGIGGTLFVLNMLIPDPLPLVDEFLILAGTILLSRMARTGDGWCNRADGCDRGATCGSAEARRQGIDAALQQELRQLGTVTHARTQLRGPVSNSSVTHNNPRERRVDMPGIMFQDVVCSRAQSNRKWYTLPLSFLVHTSVLAVLIVVPLVATDVLPRPRAIMEFVTPYVPVVPTPPPPSRPEAPPLAAGSTAGAPVVAPDTIGVESGVIFSPATSRQEASTESSAGLTWARSPSMCRRPLRPRCSSPAVVGGHIKPPLRIKGAMPAYPDIARMARVQGIVIIEAVIAPDGTVEQARVLRSKPLLDEAALAAVRGWEYTPTLLNGRPTAVIMTVTVNSP